MTIQSTISLAVSRLLGCCTVPQDGLLTQTLLWLLQQLHSSTSSRFRILSWRTKFFSPIKLEGFKGSEVAHNKACPITRLSYKALYSLYPQHKSRVEIETKGFGFLLDCSKLGGQWNWLLEFQHRHLLQG